MPCEIGFVPRRATVVQEFGEQPLSMTFPFIIMRALTIIVLRMQLFFLGDLKYDQRACDHRTARNGELQTIQTPTNPDANCKRFRLRLRLPHLIQIFFSPTLLSARTLLSYHQASETNLNPILRCEEPAQVNPA